MVIHGLKKTLVSLLLALLVIGLAPLNFDTTNASALHQLETPITLEMSATNDWGIRFDPLLATDRLSIETITNLFFGLTDIDPVTQAIRPKIATDWTISEDGKTWTFHLRNDVMWSHATALGEVATERPVVAGDFVYSLKRACDPRLRHRNDVLADVIIGCEEISSMPRDEVTDELVFGDTVQVNAPDDTTLVIHQAAPAGYFLSLTAMPIMRPVPMETIDLLGNERIDVTKFLSSGPFVLMDYAYGGTAILFERNTLLPADLYSASGNIELISLSLFSSTGYDVGNQHRRIYLTHEVDVMTLELAGTDGESWMTENDLDNELLQVPSITTLFFRYNMATPPFDDVHTRRAFSAIIDRQQLIDDLGYHYYALPMIHFTPPSILHAPPIDEIGVGFALSYAHSQMDLGAYLNCENFLADIYTTGRGSRMPEQWKDYAVTYLGCDPIYIEAGTNPENSLDPPQPPDPPERIRFYSNAMLSITNRFFPVDVYDVHFFLSDNITCTNHMEGVQDRSDFLRLTRSCTDVEDLIELAADTTDLRDEQYTVIEDMLFGEDGEFPVVPILVVTDNYLVKPWIDGPFNTDIIYGMRHWNAYTIDMEAKLAARND